RWNTATHAHRLPDPRKPREKRLHHHHHHHHRLRRIPSSSKMGKGKNYSSSYYSPSGKK
ncbi:unnamed protein product, partial [Ectocarpus sp. 12 AP-2014]